MAKDYQSWGRYPVAKQAVIATPWRSDNLPNQNNILPYGAGKSYGDAALNDDGSIITTTNLNHLIAFNKDTGHLTCESGVTLAEILQIIVPHGWFLPTSPGTKFITVGGAIANDIHGKNHHRAGTFGHHVLQFELLRSDGSRPICSPTQNTELFHATIGGLGLTGLITWAQIDLTKINNPYIEADIIPMRNSDDFFRISAETDSTHDYTVAWLDISASGKSIGRGSFSGGNFANQTNKNIHDTYHHPRLTLPIAPPFPLVTPLSTSIFNVFYRHHFSLLPKHSQVHYDPFFYPLDGVNHWNVLYGPKGFFQYQCVVPLTAAPEAVRELLQRLHHSHLGSPLTVLKMFGNKPSLGYLSFPRPGATLALDIMNRPGVLELMTEFDTVVQQAQGAVYLAKDARLSPTMFQHSYPKWQEFAKHIDPAFSSSLWRRVTKVS